MPATIDADRFRGLVQRRRFSGVVVAAPAAAALAGMFVLAGPVAVAGLASNATWRDWLISGLCLPAARLFSIRPDFGSPGAPIADSTLSWRQVRRQARELLPGARYRRHLYYRYSMRWTKPQPAKSDLTQE